jgi:hypothetical protein
MERERTRVVAEPVERDAAGCTFSCANAWLTVHRVAFAAGTPSDQTSPNNHEEARTISLALMLGDELDVKLQFSLLRRALRQEPLASSTPSSSFSFNAVTVPRSDASDGGTTATGPLRR